MGVILEAVGLIWIFAALLIYCCFNKRLSTTVAPAGEPNLKAREVRLIILSFPFFSLFFVFVIIMMVTFIPGLPQWFIIL